MMWQLLLPPFLVGLSLLVLIIKFEPAGPQLPARASVYPSRLNVPRTEIMVNEAAASAIGENGYFRRQMGHVVVFGELS